MKNYVLSVVVLILLASAAFANKNLSFANKAKVNYLQCLESEKNSVVEAAIFNVMGLKQRHPEADYSDVIRMLNKLSNRSADPIIRNKAYLALNYIKNIQWFGKYQIVGQEDSSFVFDKIARELDIRNKISFINTK